jgi:hypothetical protein
MALSVPLSRSTLRVGGGSAFFVRHIYHAALPDVVWDCHIGQHIPFTDLHMTDTFTDCLGGRVLHLPQLRLGIAGRSHEDGTGRRWFGDAVGSRPDVAHGFYAWQLHCGGFDFFDIRRVICPTSRWSQPWLALALIRFGFVVFHRFSSTVAQLFSLGHETILDFTLLVWLAKIRAVRFR